VVLHSMAAINWWKYTINRPYRLLRGGYNYGYIGYYAKAIYTEPYISKLSITDEGYIIYTDGELISLIGYKGTETDLVLPEGITEINQYAFRFCDSLTSVEIPDSVTSIGGWAFQDCGSLTSVVIGESVTRIGSGAFSWCYHLVEVYNKSSLPIAAGDSAYGEVGYYAKAVYTEPYTSKLSITDEGYILYTDGELISLIGYKGTETDLVLPEGVTEINQYAFYNCDSLTSVIIPDSVTSIGSCAFQYCGSLISITFKDAWTWYRTNNKANWNNKTGGTQTSVTNVSTNATYFTDTYEDYYWYKL